MISFKEYLNEIVDTKYDNLKLGYPYDKEHLTSIKRNFDGEQGGFAFGSDDEDSHLFNKETFYPSDLKNDGYYQYIKAIKPLISGNPYLPRVYLVDEHEDSNGDIIPHYKIEKLKKYNEFSPEVLYSIGENLSPEFEKFYEEKYKNKFQVDSKLHSATLVFRTLVEFVNKNLNNLDVFSDSKFKSALVLIKKLVNSNKYFKYDLHAGNFMIRGTSVGPQLVITDPISDEGYSIKQKGEYWGSTPLSKSEKTEIQTK